MWWRPVDVDARKTPRSYHHELLVANGISESKVNDPGSLGGVVPTIKYGRDGAV